jgi:hypothetical protein
MDYTGSIRLLTESLGMVRSRHYYGRSDRDRIIQKWEKEIGVERFKKCFIQICPNAKEITEEELLKKIKRTVKKGIPCHPLKLKIFTFETSKQYKKKNLS